MVFMPEARKPLICAAVKPLAPPMPPFQKSIAVVAACDGPANNSSKPSVILANHNILRGITIFLSARTYENREMSLLPSCFGGRRPANAQLRTLQSMTAGEGVGGFQCVRHNVAPVGKGVHPPNMVRSISPFQGMDAHHGLMQNSCTPKIPCRMTSWTAGSVLRM